MKIYPKISFGLLATTAVLLVGCGDTSTPSPERPTATVPEYRLDEAEERKMTQAGCRIEASSILCDDKSNSVETTRKLDDLYKAQQRLVKQIDVLRGVQASLDAKLKANSISAEERANAARLSQSLSTRREDLVARSGAKDAEIATEKKFDQIAGFRCEGSSVVNTALTPILETLSRPSAGWSDVESRLKLAPLSYGVLKASSRGIALGVTDPQAGSDRQIRFSVQTPGEFFATTATDSKLNLGCFKIRGTEAAKVITDRPVEKRRWTCMSNSDVANPMKPSKPDTTGWTVTFNVNSDDANRVSNLGGPDLDTDEHTKDFMKDSIYSRVAYAVRLTSNAGTLKFEVVDFVTRAVLFSVITSNSVPELKLSFADQKMNAIRLLCADNIKL